MHNTHKSIYGGMKNMHEHIKPLGHHTRKRLGVKKLPPLCILCLGKSIYDYDMPP